MTARLQREKDELNTANQTVMQRVEKLSTENGDLSVNNAALKVQVTEQLAREIHYCNGYKKHLLHTYVHNYSCRQLTDKQLSISNFLSVLSESWKHSLIFIYITKIVLAFVWLQASVAQLEQQLADCESELVEEKVASQEKKHQVEQSQYQVDICSLILLFTFYLVFNFTCPNLEGYACHSRFLHLSLKNKDDKICSQKKTSNMQTFGL